MLVRSDVLVIGCGIAGLMAALASVQQGATVTVVGAGTGTFSLSSGCIDLLGAIKRKRVEDPWQAMEELAPNHPYRLLGTEQIQEGLSFFQELLQNQGCTYTVATKEGRPVNSLIPTILGTFKPSYLVPTCLEASRLFSAKSVLVCGINGLRDTSPTLVQKTFAESRLLKNVTVQTHMLTPALHADHRSFSALDLARYVNTEEGCEWLCTSLGRFARSVDVLLLPPICGTSRSEQIITRLRTTLGCHVSEMLSIPPGVGGLRLHAHLLREAQKAQIRFVENCTINACSHQNGIVEKVQAKQPSGTLTFEAKAYVLATGGILGGGLTVTPQGLTEEIFHFPLAQPDQPLTGTDIFEEHLLSRLGVPVEKSLRAIDSSGQIFLNNVFLAGRILDGYDYAAEKSGHGVAITTGYASGKRASAYAKEEA